MTGTRLVYAAITPTRDEAENLRRLRQCMADQTVKPVSWIIVDTGSSDRTPEVTADLVRQYPWAHAMQVDGGAMAPGAPIVRAFNAGLAEVASWPDVIVKLDADVSFDETYFEKLLAEFEADPKLGIASGVCWELEHGEWTPRHVTGDHVRGATRAYRADCLRDVLPLPETVGWDGVDELKASVEGWRTASIAALRFNHHRPVGARDGARTARLVAEGRCSHYMGYSPLYLLARAVGRCIRDRSLAPLAILKGYAAAVISREPKYPDEAVRRYLREQQRMRHIPTRMRESFGKRAAA